MHGVLKYWLSVHLKRVGCEFVSNYLKENYEGAIIKWQEG